MFRLPPSLSFFFFNDTATTEIYTLSLHDALPISFTDPGILDTHTGVFDWGDGSVSAATVTESNGSGTVRDRKSTRLNSSHGYISYAVFCLKKKRQKRRTTACVCGCSLENLY